jgi:hypothetical protein
MIGTVFASPQREINEIEIHIGLLERTTLLRSSAWGERMHLRKYEAHHGKTARIVGPRPLERSAIRSAACRGWTYPGLRSAPSGLQTSPRTFVISPHGFLTLSALPPRP